MAQRHKLPDDLGNDVRNDAVHKFIYRRHWALIIMQPRKGAWKVVAFSGEQQDLESGGMEFMLGVREGH